MNISDCIYYPATPSSTYARENFKSSTIGTSDCNTYLPLYSMFHHELISFKDKETRVMEYALPTIPSYCHNFRNFGSLLAYLKSTQQVVRFNFVIAGEPHYVFLHRGLMLSAEGEVLMCIGIDTEYLMGTPYALLRDTPDYNKYILFVSNKLLQEARYKNLLKRLEKEYFPYFSTANIDVVYSSKIPNWIFKNNYKKPKFKSVKESTQHLKEDIPKLLAHI